MTNFNERTNTLLYKKIYLSHFILERVDVSCVWEVGGDKDGLLFWPSSSSDHSSTSSSSWLGCSTVVHWGPKALCQPLALNSESYLQLTRTASDTWSYNCLASTCFRCSSTYLHWCISWLTARSRVNMLQDEENIDRGNQKHGKNQWIYIFPFIIM